MSAPSTPGVNFDYTYNGKLLTEVFFKPTVGTRAIGDFFTIHPMIKYKEQIPLLLPLEKIVKRYTSCARTFNDGIDITNTTVSLTDLELNQQWCKDDFEQTLRTGNILAEEWLKSGVDEFNPTGTQINKIINQLVEDALRRDNDRIIWFADTDDAVADWAQLDGVWKKLIANAGGGGSYCVNQAYDFDAGALSAGEALTALKACYDDSAIILKQLPKAEKYFAVTGTVFENLMASYESNSAGSDMMFLNIVKGQGDSEDSLSYRGIEVIPMYSWDDALTDTDNPIYGREHLILYTTKKNHVVGVDRPQDAEKISGWYERKDRKYYIEGFHRMGYNYLHCDLQTIGA